jgi:hypothetical protein
MIPRASGTKMHADDVEIDEPLVRLPLAEQFPDWADRPLHRVEPEGTESAILPARRTSPSDCFLLAFGVGLEESPKTRGGDSAQVAPGRTRSERTFRITAPPTSADEFRTAGRSEP